jgi:hypothetical protein
MARSLVCSWVGIWLMSDCGRVNWTLCMSGSRHILNGAEVRATLLDAVVRLALLLRRRHQSARLVTLTLKFAGAPRGRGPKKQGLVAPLMSSASVWMNVQRRVKGRRDLCVVPRRAFPGVGRSGGAGPGTWSS